MLHNRLVRPVRRVVRPKLVVVTLMAAPLILIGCGQGKRNIDERVNFPQSTAVLVAESDPYGGGAGSVYRDIFIVSDSQREKVVSSRSIRPLRIAIKDGGRTVTINVCKGRIFKSDTASILPYGANDPVRIQAEVTNSCGS